MRSIKFLLLFFLLFNFSCIYGLDYEYTTNPVFLSINEINNKIGVTFPKTLRYIGKVYQYKNYLFIGETNLGVHVIDNTGYKTPQKIAFIKIPFNTDIAIKNDILYANNLNSIISFDISHIDKAKMLYDKISIVNKLEISDKNNIEKIQIGYKTNGPKFKPFILTLAPVNIFPGLPSVNTPPTSAPNTSTGKGGSLAGFSIVNDYLYTITPSSINVFSLKDVRNPEKIRTVQIEGNENDVETIFGYKDKLFLGSSTGVYIYDNKDPQKPTPITKIAHIKKRDPIVVQNNTVYVTLRGIETGLLNSTGELDIIDISDIKNSKIIKTYPLSSPLGLAIKENYLFVCTNSEGLQIFDIKDPLDIKSINSVDIKNPNDIIISDNNQGLISSQNGIYQYNFSDIQNIKQSSFIPAINDKDTSNHGSINSYRPILESEISSSPPPNKFNSNYNINDEGNSKKEGDTYYFNWYVEYLKD